jgi:hypothetical protein
MPGVVTVSFSVSLSIVISIPVSTLEFGAIIAVSRFAFVLRGFFAGACAGTFPEVFHVAEVFPA